jgi:hypothetical protein
MSCLKIRFYAASGVSNPRHNSILLTVSKYLLVHCIIMARNLPDRSNRYFKLAAPIRSQQLATTTSSIFSAQLQVPDSVTAELRVGPLSHWKLSHLMILACILNFTCYLPFVLLGRDNFNCPNRDVTEACLSYYFAISPRSGCIPHVLLRLVRQWKCDSLLFKLNHSDGTSSWIRLFKASISSWGALLVVADFHSRNWL